MPGMPKSPMLMMHPDMPVMRFAEGDVMARMGMGQPEPAQQEDSFNMLRMFMELTPEEKMMVAGPGFNEMTEDEVAMAMYNFISEGRSLTGGREVDYMDPDKQGLANGGIVSLMGG